MRMNQLAKNVTRPNIAEVGMERRRRKRTASLCGGASKDSPSADSDWPMDGRRKWLQAASHIFELIYKDSESKGSLRIEVQKESSK